MPKKVQVGQERGFRVNGRVSDSTGTEEEMIPAFWWAAECLAILSEAARGEAAYSLVRPPPLTRRASLLRACPQ